VERNGVSLARRPGGADKKKKKEEKENGKGGWLNYCLSALRYRGACDSEGDQPRWVSRIRDKNW